jgi:hypothetical protein
VQKFSKQPASGSKRRQDSDDAENPTEAVGSNTSSSSPKPPTPMGPAISPPRNHMKKAAMLPQWPPSSSKQQVSTDSQRIAASQPISSASIGKVKVATPSHNFPNGGSSSPKAPKHPMPMSLGKSTSSGMVVSSSFSGESSALKEDIRKKNEDRKARLQERAEKDKLKHDRMAEMRAKVRPIGASGKV